MIVVWNYSIEHSVKWLFMIAILGLPTIDVLGKPWIDNHIGVQFFSKHFRVYNLDPSAVVVLQPQGL